MPTEIQLRDVTESDLPTMFEHQRDQDANRMAAFPPRDWEAFTAHWAKILKDETLIAKAILCDGNLAGNIGSWIHDGKPLIGYWLGKEYWGKGIATKALAAFLYHAKARPIYAYVAKHNVASIRVLEKCGFTVFGEGRSASSLGGDEVDEWLMIFDDRESSELVG